MKSFLAILATCLLSAQPLVSEANVLSDISVINRSTGERLPLYAHAGKLYIAGKPGDRYAIELRNRTGERVLTVVSVDGVNVLSGETAAASQSGYVLSPGGVTEIAGWRKSDRDVAAFYFTALPDSYAARTARPDNVGVIGVATFREYREPPPVVYDNAMSRKSESMAGGLAREAAPASAPAMDARAAQADKKLGTGHGERIYSQTQRVEFRRASATPDEVISIQYDSFRNLVALGVIPKVRTQHAPQPFPGDGYVPDPS